MRRVVRVGDGKPSSGEICWSLDLVTQKDHQGLCPVPTRSVGGRQISANVT